MKTNIIIINTLQLVIILSMFIIGVHRKLSQWVKWVQKLSKWVKWVRKIIEMSQVRIHTNYPNVSSECIQIIQMSQVSAYKLSKWVKWVHTNYPNESSECISNSDPNESSECVQMGGSKWVSQVSAVKLSSQDESRVGAEMVSPW